jgi:hypothetical protein
MEMTVFLECPACMCFSRVVADRDATWYHN